MKRILFFIGLTVCIQSCSFLNTIRTHCKIEASTTPNGNSLFCAVCDSTTGKTIINTIKP